MNFIAVLGALAIILSAGLAALFFLEPKGSSEGLAARLALSWLLGTGIVSLLVWVFGFFASGPWLPFLVATTCIAVVLAGWIVSRRNPCAPSRSVTFPERAEWVLGALVAAEIVVIFYLCFVHTLGGDGILNWEIKARYAYLNGGVLPATYLQDTSRSFTHVDYPLAIPYTELWLYFWLGEANQFWAKTIFALFYVAGVILLATLGIKLTGRTSVALAMSILLFFVPQISIGGGNATVGYADFALSVLYLATIGYLLCACRSKHDSSFWIYAGCLALLPWIKREGAILWLVAVLCGALVIWRTKRRPAHLLALAPGFLLIVAWHFYLWKMHTAVSSEFLPVNLGNLVHNIHRLGPILSAFLAELFNAKVWSLFWLMVAIGGIYFVRRYPDVRSTVLLIAMLAPICIYVAIYIFSDWPDYQQHVGLSVSRLFMQIAPLACLTISAALATTYLGKGRHRVEEREAV